MESGSAAFAEIVCRACAKSNGKDPDRIWVYWKPNHFKPIWHQYWEYALNEMQEGGLDISSLEPNRIHLPAVPLPDA